MNYIIKRGYGAGEGRREGIRWAKGSLARRKVFVFI